MTTSLRTGTQTPVLRICRICNGEANKVLHVREMMLGTREVFDYVQCSACHCLQIAEIPDDIGRYYPGDYYSYDTRRHNSVKRVRRGMRRRWILTAPAPVAVLLGLLSPSDELFHAYRRLGLKVTHRLLDVGAGSGAHVLDLHDAGVTNAVGVDLYVPKNITMGDATLCINGILGK